MSVVLFLFLFVVACLCCVVQKEITPCQPFEMWSVWQVCVALVVAPLCSVGLDVVGDSESDSILVSAKATLTFLVISPSCFLPPQSGFQGHHPFSACQKYNTLQASTHVDELNIVQICLTFLCLLLLVEDLFLLEFLHVSAKLVWNRFLSKVYLNMLCFQCCHWQRQYHKKTRSQTNSFCTTWHLPRKGSISFDLLSLLKKGWCKGLSDYSLLASSWRVQNLPACNAVSQQNHWVQHSIGLLKGTACTAQPVKGRDQKPGQRVRKTHIGTVAVPEYWFTW